MNNTSCFKVSLIYERRFLPSVYILVFIIGLAANGCGLNFLVHNWKKLGNINVFILNLGLSDILYLLTLPFFVVYYFMNSRWIFGDVFCKTARFCFNLNLYGSIGFLTCISVYRYLAIVHPVRVKGRITVTHSVIISVIVWLFVGVQSLPEMYFVKTSQNRSRSCYHTTHKRYLEDYQKYSLVSTLLGFCIPFVITVACYGQMIVILYRKNTIDKALKHKSLMLLFILIVLFSVCYIPHHVFKNLNLWARVLSRDKVCLSWFNGVYIANQISRGLVCLNSALNPLVYLLRHENICAQIRQLLRQAPQSISGFIGVAQTAEES
ncbi:P2Y purinoceptor 1 [Aulostomus maculatus]